MALAPPSLAALGEAGVRLTLVGDHLHVRRPDHLDPRELAALRADLAAVKAAVERMDAGLAEALAVLDALAARPGATPARLNVIRLRAEVYRECRERLDQADLAEDARHFARRVLSPGPRVDDWLGPRERRPERTPQETNR